MGAVAGFIGLCIGLGLLFLLLKGYSFISDKIEKRRFEDNGGKNRFFYTPKITTELLRKFKCEYEEGKISSSTFYRRRRKAIKKFMEVYNSDFGYIANMTVGTNDSVEHFKQLKIMLDEGLITQEEYDKIYKLYVNVLSKLK